MAAALTQLTGGNFTDSEGNVLANGYLTFQLSQDGNVAGVGNLCSGITVKIQLDSTGNVAGVSSMPPVSNQYLWANANISPINTFYKVTGYTAAGQRAWGLNNQQVGAGATFNLGSWVPNSVISWFPTIGATPLAVEVRGAAFSSTTLLNFESSDSSVTITDEGSGLLNFQSASSLNVEVNGTPVSSTNPINFESGAGVVVSNPSAGNILITNSAPGAVFSGAGAAQFAGPGITLAPLAQNLTGVQLPGDGTTYVYKFVLDSSWTLTSCTFVWGNNLNGTISFALYTSSGAKISNTDNFMNTGVSVNPSDTPVQNTFAATVLPAGVYYFAYASSGGSGLNVPGCAGSFSSNFGTAFLGMLNTTGIFVGTAANSRTGNAMPSTLGALTGASVGVVMPTPIWAT